jgi:predicted nucleic acid-binding protein
MRLVVLDASVALAWVIGDEEPSEPAARVIAAARRGELRFIAPALWAYEVVSGLRGSVRSRRLTRDGADEALPALLGLDVVLYGPEVTIARALQICLTSEVNSYDASYVALAEVAGCHCLTADRRLLNAAADTGLVRWIGDYE